MSMFEILYLLGAIFAFVTLAALLTWDEHRARHSSALGEGAKQACVHVKRRKPQ